MKYEIEFDAPEGYEPTGEMRMPNPGEPWLGERGTGSPYAIDNFLPNGHHIILRRVLPDTLTVKGLPRAMVEHLSACQNERDANAPCLAALEAEAAS